VRHIRQGDKEQWGGEPREPEDRGQESKEKGWIGARRTTGKGQASRRASKHREQKIKRAQGAEGKGAEGKGAASRGQASTGSRI
jgi:hypothetical protein